VSTENTTALGLSSATQHIKLTSVKLLGEAAHRLTVVSSHTFKI